jgi:hypothetical protein
MVAPFNHEHLVVANPSSMDMKAAPVTCCNNIDMFGKGELSFLYARRDERIRMD